MSESTITGAPAETDSGISPLENSFFAVPISVSKGPQPFDDVIEQGIEEQFQESVEDKPQEDRIKTPVEGYQGKTDVRSAIRKFTECMKVDENVLLENPKDPHEAWDQLEHWFNAITVSKEFPKYVRLHKWSKAIPIPRIEEVDDFEEALSAEKAVGDLLVMHSIFSLGFDYEEKGDLGKRKTMRFGDLIADVYPALGADIKNIEKNLEFAARDPYGFKKKYGFDEKMTRREFLRKVFTVGTAIFSLGTLAACAIKVGANTEDANNLYDNTPKVTQPLEQTSTPTESQTSTPTEAPTTTPTSTATETQEPTPIVEGNIEDLTENMEEGDIIWSMFELQRIVNGYDQGSGISFSDYIAEAKGNISSEGSYERVYRILEKFEELGELNSMSLIYALKEAYPEIYFPDMPEGFSSLADALPENLKNFLIEYGKKIEAGKYVELEYSLVYDGMAVVRPETNYERGFFHNGTIFVDGNNYEEGFPEFINTIILIKQIEKDGIIYPVGVMIDENGQLKLVFLSNETGPNILSGSYQIYIVSNDALLEGVELPEEEREP